MVEEIVDLDKELQPIRCLITRAEIVTDTREARAKVVNSVLLMQIILISTREGAAHGIEIQIDGKLLDRMGVQVGFENVSRRLRKLVSGSHGDVSFEAQATVVCGVTGRQP